MRQLKQYSAKYFFPFHWAQSRGQFPCANTTAINCGFCPLESVQHTDASNDFLTSKSNSDVNVIPWTSTSKCISNTNLHTYKPTWLRTAPSHSKNSWELHAASGSPFSLFFSSTGHWTFLNVLNVTVGCKACIWFLEKYDINVDSSDP